MKRNDDNDPIRKARKTAKFQKEANDNMTKEEKDIIEEVKTNSEEFKNKEENIESINTINEENINREKEKVNKNRKKIYIGIICFFVLIGIMYFCTKRYDNLVYPNITLYNEDVSKLNKNELDNKCNILLNKINKNTINVKIENKQYEIKVNQIIKKINKEKVENEIMSYGKDKFFLEQFGLIYLNVGRQYKYDVQVDNKAVGKKVREIYNDTTTPAVNPTLEINGEKVKIVSGRNGKGIDEKSLIKKIKQSVKSEKIVKNNISFTEEYKTIKPKINEKDLTSVKDKISTATTYFGGTGYNRGLNIANAASKINGTLLMPGDEFSYEEAVSPVELYNGYYLAPVIVNGTHKNAPGGGVCQVCTTLYNAELKAGIIPTERYNHSKSIGYIQKGLDATLATGSKNLRFKNIYKYPVYIRSYTVGGQITVEFWSNKNVLDGKKYTPVSFVKGNVANTYLYGYNNNGKLIYKKFIDTSVYK